MKPFEIDGLHRVFKESCKNKEVFYTKFPHKFANHIGCTNITEYCAATEYAARCLKDEVATRRENGKKDKSKHYYYETVSQELLTDQNQDFMNFVENFRQLQTMYDTFQQNTTTRNPKFANSMAAANHYDKHKNDFRRSPRRSLTVEEYFNLAVDLTSGQVADCRVECQWTQDGTSLRREFVSETHNAFAVVFDRPDGTSVIATLHELSDKQVGLLRTTRKPAIADIACTNVAIFLYKQRSVVNSTCVCLLYSKCISLFPEKLQTCAKIYGHVTSNDLLSNSIEQQSRADKTITYFRV